MADKTGIQWTDATVNFWWGCTKVAPACDHCYAETWKRTGGAHWGLGAPRKKIASAVALLRRLNGGAGKFAAEHGRRRRVFIQSMADLFDLEVPSEWFTEAWGAIQECDHLDIQIATKRVSVVHKRLPEAGATKWPKHAGLLVSCGSQADLNRDFRRLVGLKQDLGIPWIGISAEPLLEYIDFNEVEFDQEMTVELLNWVIVGGESGSHARPMRSEWARKIRDQCGKAKVPFFFKQWGHWLPFDQDPERDGVSYVVFGNGSGSWRDRAYGVGKKLAGRLLDGVEHNAFPEPAK